MEQPKTLQEAIKKWEDISNYEDPTVRQIAEDIVRDLESIIQHSANTLVSGNEANPLSENKKDGEVAVAFADWIKDNNYKYGYHVWFKGIDIDASNMITTKQLYDLYKQELSAKATDR